MIWGCVHGCVTEYFLRFPIFSFPYALSLSDFTTVSYICWFQLELSPQLDFVFLADGLNYRRQPA